MARLLADSSVEINARMGLEFATETASLAAK
jgi:hypothetical protein